MASKRIVLAALAALLVAPSLLPAPAQTAPPVVGSLRPLAEPAGVDYVVACQPPIPGAFLCLPQSSRVPGYMRLANWRWVGATTPNAVCVLGVTYGYTVAGPWVSSQCPGVFRAPNLRYGDEYNAFRAPWDAVGP